MYALRADGVTRLADDAFIPNNSSNPDWRMYLDWVGGGGIPRPLSPGEQYDWNGTAWVVNAGRQALIDAAVALGADLSAVKGNSAIVTFLNMSIAQIETDLSGVTTLPQAIVRLKILAKVVAVLARKQIAS